MKDIIKIIAYSWELKRYYLWTSFFVVVVSLLNQVVPFILKDIVDGLVKTSQGNGPGVGFFWLLIGIILVTSVATTLISNVQGYIGDRLGAKLNTLLSQRYYDHILKLPLTYFDNQVAGRITSRLERSIVTISNLMNAFANNFVGFFLTALITLVILAYYAWPVAVLLGALFPLYIWITTLSSRSWQKKQEGINHNIDAANGRFVESISQIRAVKSYIQERTESRYFGDKRATIEAETKAQSIEWHWYDVARRLGLNIIFFGIYAYVVLQTLNGKYTLGELTLLLQLVTQAQFPLFASSFIVDNIQRAKAGSKDFFEVMATVPSIADARDAKPINVTTGEIHYTNVNFGYEATSQVLHDVSFTVPAGSKLALVGESGEGKTTIANLLPRFYELSSGSITIDGQDIAGVTQKSLRAAIAIVFQEPPLFSGTVFENIAYGSPRATRAEVEAAAKAANALGFISKLKSGFNTQIGERGVKLSGGQKQRLAIARAILKNAPILILDEATSALDSKAEREVQSALDRLMAGRTTIIIAHRLSTIASADQIIGIRAGRVAESGSPAELAKKGGIYAELLELQNPTEANKAKLKAYDLAA